MDSYGDCVTGDCVTGDCVTGERIQFIANMYLGTADDFMFNPLIMEQTDKHQLIHEITEPFDNPPILFLYPHRLELFVERLHLFLKSFVLITHNSDYNLLEDDPMIKRVLSSPLLKCWWGQNLCFVHPKMRPLPIGIANSMWEHGNLEYYRNINLDKTEDVYFNFNIATNPEKREVCFQAILHLCTIKTPTLSAEQGVADCAFQMRNGVKQMLPMVSVKENVTRLAKYQRCICPEGNGVDTHRLWEAIYLKCCPIVLETPFIKTLAHYMEGLPISIVKSWTDALHACSLDPVFDTKYLRLSYYVTAIKNSAL
jgi:hypothetical protein